MGSWVEKFDEGVALDDLGDKMCKLLQEIKPHIQDEKLLKKIRKAQLVFLENPDEIKYYE